MTDLQRRIQQVSDELVESGTERGLQVAVYHHGELVADAVAGVADPATGRPVTADTPFHVHSTGKGVVATLAHILAARGLFDYDTSIVELWPEFGAHGKAKATVRHALTHTVGVPGLPADTVAEDLFDWDKICAMIANLAPWWEPGTRTAYHAYTFGFIVGEIIRRATGKPISQVLREEIGEPLGIADEIYFGVPAAALTRLARLEDAEGSAEFLASLPDDSPFFKWAPRTIPGNAEFANRPEVLMADIPAGGKMSARAVARMYAALLGEVDGVQLISPERLRLATAVAFEGDDQIFGNPATWALGYSLGRPGSTPQESPTWFGMIGSGGSCAYADSASGFTFAVAKTRLAFNLNAVEAVAGIVAEAAAKWATGEKFASELRQTGGSRMSTTASRAAQYTEQFAAVNDEAIALVTGCTDAQWRLRCVDEERSVAVVAHHIAEVNGAFARMIERLASGSTYTPNIAMDEIHRQNAQHSRNYANVGKPEVLELLRTSGAAITEQLRSVDDARLDQVAGVFGGNELTVAQVIEYVVIGHTAEHSNSIRATVAG